LRAADPCPAGKNTNEDKGLFEELEKKWKEKREKKPWFALFEHLLLVTGFCLKARVQEVWCRDWRHCIRFDLKAVRRERSRKRSYFGCALLACEAVPP
jgi:hypothetical protein